MGTWLKNEGRGRSTVSRLNCLYQHDNIFVMDNHKAAIWSWLTSIDLSKKYNLMHIDRHYDLLETQLEDWVSATKIIKSGSIETYSLQEFEDITHISDGIESPVFRFDNFFPIAYNMYPHLFDKLVYITHREGDMDKKYGLVEPEVFHLNENLSFWLDNYSNGNKWILDIDIDYFFSDNVGNERDYFLSLDFAKNLADQIYDQRNLIEVFTIALSPSWCKSWDDSIEFANVFCEKFGFKIGI